MTTPFNHCRRRAVQALGPQFGPDKHRRLIVQLVPGSETGDRDDMLIFRPEGTRREHRLSVTDAYRIAIRTAANIACLAKARDRKVKRQAHRERARLDRQERKFRNDIKQATVEKYQ